MIGPFDWLIVLVSVVFWGWLFRRFLRGTPKKRLMKSIVVWFVLVISGVMFWNVYVNFYAQAAIP
jgi:hypothetical protein